MIKPFFHSSLGSRSNESFKYRCTYLLHYSLRLSFIWITKARIRSFTHELADIQYWQHRNQRFGFRFGNPNSNLN